MTELSKVTSQYHEGWLDNLDGRTEIGQKMRKKFDSLVESFGDTSHLTHQHKSLFTRILWLEYWLERQETVMPQDQNFKAGQWIQGTNALIGLYSRLEEISKRFRKVEPITISVIDAASAEKIRSLRGN
jgi:hypothetical protein